MSDHEIREYLKNVGIRPVHALYEEIVRVLGLPKGLSVIRQMNALFDAQEFRMLRNTGNDPTIARQDAMNS